MMATTTLSVCPRCGTIAKSGKRSCCGHGGSWFEECGGVGNIKLQHTWYEGIEACKIQSQSKTVIGQQQNGAQQKGINSFEGSGMINSKAVIAEIKGFTFTSLNTSTPIPDTTPHITTSTDTPDYMSTTTSVRTPRTITSINISVNYEDKDVPTNTQVNDESAGFAKHKRFLKNIPRWL